jgi:hypothetical protein
VSASSGARSIKDAFRWLARLATRIPRRHRSTRHRSAPGAASMSASLPLGRPEFAEQGRRSLAGYPVDPRQPAWVRT